LFKAVKSAIALVIDDQKNINKCSKNSFSCNILFTNLYKNLTHCNISTPFWDKMSLKRKVCPTYLSNKIRTYKSQASQNNTYGIIHIMPRHNTYIPQNFLTKHRF